MLRSILGSDSRERILTFLVSNQEGYASEIARTSSLDLFAVQKQLEQFEADGLLQSRSVGRMRVYSFNSKYPLLKELKILVEKALAHQLSLDPEKKSVPLPRYLQGYFWDYSFKDLSWSKDRDLIIRRLLTDGSWESIQWLRKQIGDDSLQRWLIAHQARGLGPRQIRFWSLILAVPKLQVESWTRLARSSPWSKR
ncbi:MAG TPA: winged helix-turn-helix domain-containing protein [Anaerolineales bacterium]